VKPASFRVLLAASLLLSAGAMGDARHASGCENEVALQISPDIQVLTASELALGAGKEAKAVEGLLRMFPRPARRRDSPIGARGGASTRSGRARSGWWRSRLCARRGCSP
jgi:hypothetical protein